MKKYIIMGALLVSGIISANTIEPKLEAFGDMVKVTYYYGNGQVQQTGFFKHGKLEGQWVAYDANGNKKSIGEYNHGIKTGKWIFWNDAILNEVTYADNTIASVKKWRQEPVADRD